MLEQPGVLEENFSHHGTTGRVYLNPLHCPISSENDLKSECEKNINTFKGLRNKTETSSHK